MRYNGMTAKFEDLKKNDIPKLRSMIDECRTNILRIRMEGTEESSLRKPSEIRNEKKMIARIKTAIIQKSNKRDDAERPR